MKMIYFIFAFVTFLPVKGTAQDFFEGKDYFYKGGFLERFHSEIENHTLDKVENYKGIIGKYICLRPDYKYEQNPISVYLEKRKWIKDWVKITNYRLRGKKDEYTITSSDRLKIIKYNRLSGNMTVARGDEEIKISDSDMDDFVLVDYVEELLRRYPEEQNSVRQLNLNNYYARLKSENTVSGGPIVIENKEAVYDGTMPYWKWKRDNVKPNNTISDEKFVINTKYIKDLPETDLSNNYDYYTHLLYKLKTIKEDTFGIYSMNEYIDLQTGDIYKNEKFHDLWESPRFLNYQKLLPLYKCDGKESLQSLLSNDKRLNNERILEGLVGESVFTLDEMKYDTITRIEESKNGKGCDVYLKNRGRIISKNLLLVKWYEGLQKMVGKKIIQACDINHSNYNKTWYEDLPEIEHKTFTIEKFEVKEYSFRVYIKNEYRSENFDAFEYCEYLLYPINIAEEYQTVDETEKCLLDKNYIYLSYDAVKATIPRKPASIKREEAKEKERSRIYSEKSSKLRHHKYVGMSLSAFLKDWPNARLNDSVTQGGATFKTYIIHDYYLIFKNGKCISVSYLR